MIDNLIQGTITNTETGESWEREHYLLDTGFELTTIVKITQIDSYVFENDSLQVSVDGLALDSAGFVFKILLEYNPESLGERDQLLQDLKLDSIFMVKGEYGVVEDTPPSIMLHYPSYRTVEPDFLKRK